MTEEEKARGFVADLYRSMLQREPDEPGLAFYTAEVTAGVRHDEIVAIFEAGDEYRRLAALSRPMAEDVARDRAAGTFPIDYQPPGEAGRCYVRRVREGFFDRYCHGPTILDVGFSGYDNPEGKTAVPGAIGVDLDFPGYDGIRLPFADGSVDTIISSHCLEHILADHAAIQDWFRVLRIGGHLICMVPNQALYEKKRFLPSRWNADHKRMYTVSTLAESFERALAVNTYRVRHLAENDRGFNYALGPDQHSDGAYEIEIVIEKIVPPTWALA